MAFLTHETTCMNPLKHYTKKNKPNTKKGKDCMIPHTGESRIGKYTEKNKLEVARVWGIAP
jgi:hypothetical protein